MRLYQFQNSRSSSAINYLQDYCELLKITYVDEIKMSLESSATQIKKR